MSQDLHWCSDDEGNRVKAHKQPEIILPDGPKCYEDLFDWPDDFARRSLQTWRLHNILTEKKAIHIHLTTSYSGAGCAEAAACQVAMAFRRNTLFDVHVKPYAQCEINGDCDSVLTSPHLFKDLLNRVSRRVVDDLARMQQQMLASGRASRRDEKNDLSNEFFGQARAYLDQQPDDVWLPTAHCVRCKKVCSWIPPLDEFRKLDPEVLHLWFELAGNTCTPWSARGKGLGWLDPASLPALIWAWSMKRKGHQPHAIVNECTPRWPGESFFQAVFDAAIIESVTFSPLDLGSWALVGPKFCQLGSPIVKCGFGQLLQFFEHDC